MKWRHRQTMISALGPAGTVGAYGMALAGQKEQCLLS